MYVTQFIYVGGIKKKANNIGKVALLAAIPKSARLLVLPVIHVLFRNSLRRFFYKKTNPRVNLINIYNFLYRV